MVDRFRVSLPTHAYQRGTDREIGWEEAIVLDHMPAVLGEQFRVRPELSQRVFFDQPISAPLLLSTDAYERVGLHHLDRGEFVGALEGYRIMLWNQTRFTGAISRAQKHVALDRNELAIITNNSLLEKRLVDAVASSPLDIDAYVMWVEEMRDFYNEWRRLNREEYGSLAYIEATIRKGDLDEAENCIIYQLDFEKDLKNKIKKARTPEILDLAFLSSCIKPHLEQLRSY